jgi:hypothetical protein
VKDIPYSGARADLATLTGSPLWGWPLPEITRRTVAKGWTLLDESRPETPYGIGPVVQSYRTRSGRTVIRIPTYGWTANKDWWQHRDNERTWWILWQAGVKVLLVGGTCGVADWRQGEDRVLPGDVVLPWSFQTHLLDHRGLPGTAHEAPWPDYDLLLDEPFCPELQKVLARELAPFVEAGKIRRVHTPADVRAALVVPSTITYESDYDIETRMALSYIMSQRRPGKPPWITLHGDCVNPILARSMGIHLAYYQCVANFAQGTSDESITESVYELYTKVLPEVALNMECSFLESAPLPEGRTCHCRTGKVAAPSEFSQSMCQAVD